MGFVTPLLLAGAALVVVPIVMHLVMRREAQHLVFPALRFLQQRRTFNQRRLRLRHLLLLALRCAIIALLALALARPILRGSGTPGKETAPVATALVFDNSLRMQYEHQNRSRLAEARELAQWLLEQFPADAPVTVVDRAGRQRGQDLDRTAAELRVERLEPSAAVRPMGDTLRDAVRWLEGKPDHRGEIYVFTDLSVEAWPENLPSEFAQWLDALPGTNVYLIDVGVLEPRNVGLGALRLSSERLASGGLLRLNTTLDSTSMEDVSSEKVVELFVADDSEPEKRGEQVVTRNDSPSAEHSIPIEFTLAGLGVGTHQGFVRVADSDALVADDVRYFTVEVGPPYRVMLLAERPEQALFLSEALAPTAASELVPSSFACEVRRYDEIPELALVDYAAVLLLDPPPLSSRSWNVLRDFAERGGGVGIFLGRNARSNEFNTEDAQRLLPAKLRWVSQEATYLRPVAIEHPALRWLRELSDAPWSEFPVFQSWELETVGTPGIQPQAKAMVVATYANGKPALVERNIGSGRVMMLTTSLSDPAYDDPWNLLPTGPDPWPFLALANSLAEYLVGARQMQLNYLAGQSVLLPLDAGDQLTGYVLQMPDGNAIRQSLLPGQQELLITATDLLGNYRVRAGGRQERIDRGFSVNIPAEATRLERVSEDGIVQTLGKGRTRIARTPAEIEVRMGQARTGRELFPILILAVALVLAAEQWLANRFYEGRASDNSEFAVRKSESMLATAASFVSKTNDQKAKAQSRQPTSVP